MQEETLDWIRPSVKLVVEATDDGGMEVTYASMSNEEIWRFTIFMIEKMEALSGIPYNDICEDLKETIVFEEEEE